MALWVPPAVAQQRTADILERVHGTLERFNAELKRIDPYLQLVRADPRADHPSLRPGYWHILRVPPDAPSMIRVIEGPNGEYREPDSQVFEELRHDDMWSDRSRRERERRQRELKRARDAERRRETEDRRQEMYERLRSKTVLQVAVPKEVSNEPA